MPVADPAFSLQYVARIFAPKEVSGNAINVFDEINSVLKIPPKNRECQNSALSAKSLEMTISRLHPTQPLLAYC